MEKSKNTVCYQYPACEKAPHGTCPSEGEKIESLSDLFNAPKEEQEKFLHLILEQVNEDQRKLMESTPKDLDWRSEFQKKFGKFSIGYGYGGNFSQNDVQEFIAHHLLLAEKRGHEEGKEDCEMNHSAKDLCSAKEGRIRERQRCIEILRGMKVEKKPLEDLLGLNLTDDNIVELCKRVAIIAKNYILDKAILSLQAEE